MEFVKNVTNFLFLNSDKTNSTQNLLYHNLQLDDVMFLPLQSKNLLY